ncbi:MAG: SAM-dependent methyltransferase [Acidobacteriota bacterium]|nr:SAM-dependent methyltransferase [Acidobacteriota bacterium]
MPAGRSLRDVLRNSLQYGPLSFRDFMEMALYHPELGYYTRQTNPVGKAGDYVTAPSLSPVFAFAIARLFREFVNRADGEVCSFVDIGCGDGELVRAVASQMGGEGVRFFGVDRSLERVSREPPLTLALSPAGRGDLDFVRTLDEVPRDGMHFIFSSELYDAIPFARLVQRGEHLHELFVIEREGELDWSEHEAPAAYEDYFSARGIELAEGQFADVTLEWEAFHEDAMRFVTRGLVVTLDYGYTAPKLFHPRARRFGTAAAYSGQRVHRDLLTAPGEQDLTAHINFSDLERAGERQGAKTLFFDGLAKFLLSIGATEHELFKPIHETEIASAEEGIALIAAREEARRLILPDGMGEDLRVLVQGKDVSFENWSFQRSLF